MAHLQTPPRQSSTAGAKAYGLVTPSTPVALCRYTKDPQRCPDAPFLPAGFILPSRTLRTSPRTKAHHDDPPKVAPSMYLRARTVAADHGTLLQSGMPPTPQETPIAKRRREEEMRRRIEESTKQSHTTTNRQLFPLKPVLGDALAPPSKPAFEIFTDTVHREPLSSPNNPFSFDNSVAVAAPRGLSPRKRKHAAAPVQQLGPHEMYYSFRGKRIVRKVAPGPNGESWRDAIRPTRLFQKEIEEAEEGRRRKRRREMMEETIQGELDTEVEDAQNVREEEDAHQWD